MEFEIPVFGTEVDTSEPGESAAGLAGALVAGTLLIAIVAGAQWLFNSGRSVAGVGSDVNVPGV